MRHETRDPLKCIEREWMHKAWVLDTTRLWWLSKLLCPHLQVLMPHVSSPHPNTGETDQTKIKPMQIKQVADSFGMMNGLAENRLLSMDVTRRHLKQSVHRLFFFFFFQRIQVSFEAVICSRFGFDLAVFAWEARLSTGFLIELTQITSGDYQVVRKPPEGTMFVYHSADSLHRHIRSPECFIVPRKVSRHSSHTRNHTIRRRPLSATVVLM